MEGNKCLLRKWKSRQKVRKIINSPEQEENNGLSKVEPK
jgi:hypothetical protein